MVTYNLVLAKQAGLNTMVLVATEVEVNGKIQNIVDIVFVILNIWFCKHIFLSCLMKNRNRVQLLPYLEMAARKTLKY